MTETSGWRFGFRLAWYLPRRYVLCGLLWVIVIAFPILTGLVLRALFDRISDGATISVRSIGWLLVVFVVVDIVRQSIFWLAITTWTYWWGASQTLLRSNALDSILCAPGPAAGRLPASSGEALNRFRDDVEDLVLLVDIWIDLAGDTVFSAIALVIMFGIAPTVTLVIVLPLLAVIVVTRLLSERIKATHSAARKAAADVSEQLGSLFGGVLSLKVAGAETNAIERLREHNAVRRVLEVRARLLTDLLDTMTASSVEISTGLVLLLAAGSMRNESFTVGDLALFTAYVGWLAGLPRRVGRTLYRQRQATVAGQRLLRLLPEAATHEDLIAYRPIWFSTPAPPVTHPTLSDADRLVRLELRGLTAPGDRIRDIELVVERGQLVVVTGPVGSGKTTLLRTTLGLTAIERGTVVWNGRTVEDPGSFLVPPRVAYAGQVPRLWSAALGENLLLGWPASGDEIARALTLAMLATEVDAMPDGLDTVVGPRGVRLSGGQVQRAVAARALIRTPELLVVDDLSSALDVETERALWDGLAAPGPGRPGAFLVVSHRRPALERANRIVVLDRGHVIADGGVEDAVAAWPALATLWREEGAQVASAG